MLACRFSAMEQGEVPEPLNTRLQESFVGTADWMRKQED